MTTPGYSRAEASGAGGREPASIMSIDVINRMAVAMLRSRYTVNVNCGYAVGDAIVTPAIGEQWYIERFDLEWRLVGRIPFNDPTLNIEPEPGQVSVGSASGPLELNGTEVRANGTFRIDGVLLRDTGTRLERSTNDGGTWIPVVPPGGPGAPASTDEVPEGVTNLYYTTARASAAAPVQQVAGRTGNVTLTKTDVGLNNVDNTTDVAKPISSATASALASKADLVLGVVPGTQLPPPAVVTYANFASFVTPGKPNTLYIAADTGSLYWWNGVSFDLMVSGSGALSNTDELPEGTTNLYYTDVRAAAAAPVQNSDSRLTNTRTPTDNTVTTAKIVDGNVTLIKLSSGVQDSLGKADTAIQPNTVPYDVYYLQTLLNRLVGYGDNTMGIKLQHNVTLTSVTFRCSTADASGNLVAELRKNGSTVAGTSTTLAAANQVIGVSSSGSWSFSAGDILTVYITAVGTTPGKGLAADITGVTA